jgi:hypothetical protein
MLPLNVHIFGAAKKNTSNSLTKILTLQKKKKKKKKEAKKQHHSFSGSKYRVETLG